MSDQAEVAGEALATMIGTSFAGTVPSAPSAPVVESKEVEEVEPAEKFEFDAEFQSRIVYLAATDAVFMRKTAHLLKADYFENADEANFLALTLRHWKEYEATINDADIFRLAFKDAINARIVRKEDAEGLKEVWKTIAQTIKAVRANEIQGLNADFVADQVSAFCRQQAVIAAVTKSVDLIVKGDFEKIEKLVSDATQVGLHLEENGGDYFERLQLRTNRRADESVGKRAPRGITTGHPMLDKLLYHRGWGRRELNVLMGGAKAGKTTALIEFGVGASMAGFNVLYATLEVSNEIIEERADARVTDTPMSDLLGRFGQVNDKVTELAQSGKCGRFYIAEFPSGSMSPAMLKSLLERHKTRGWNYDLVIVDYADIMAPDYRTNDPIENSKQVYIGLRAIAQEWNCAMLTATQSNREGYKAITAKAEHVADDFNKVRTADLFITINKTEEEMRDGKARLYFAASRNQRSGMTVFIQQDFNRMQFIKMIERVE